MARRALLVGVNDYDNLGPDGQLTAAIPDAQRVGELLSINADGAPNYSCHILTSDAERITRATLRKAISELLHGTDDDAIFYFSGHGVVTHAGGLIVTQDAADFDEGISMDELLGFANKASEREITVILDCCMSGKLGDPSMLQTDGAYQRSQLRQGVTILAASRGNEVAVETGEHGLFTGLLIDALQGGAADILGNITLPAVYAFIEGALGPWDQRPIYKTYVSSVGILRRGSPEIDLPSLRQLVDIFPTPQATLQLDPEYEYDEAPDTDKQRVGELLKRFRDVRLIEPVVAGEQLYWVAMKSGSVRLTPSGRHFWRLIASKLV